VRVIGRVLATIGRLLLALIRRIGQPRTLRVPATRPGVDWKQPDPAGAPRLGSHRYIGHDVRGRGAWRGRDPLRTPRWWSGARWGGLLGWAGLTAGAGYLSWRQHGGMEGLFPEEESPRESTEAASDRPGGDDRYPAPAPPAG
jgi:hypothetical protein